MVIVKEGRFLLCFSQRCICQQHQSRTAPELCHCVKGSSGAIERSHQTERLQFGAGLGFFPAGLFHNLIEICMSVYRPSWTTGVNSLRCWDGQLPGLYVQIHEIQGCQENKENSSSWMKISTLFREVGYTPQPIVVRRGISEEWIHDLSGPSALRTLSLPYLVPYNLCSYSLPLSQQR